MENEREKNASGSAVEIQRRLKIAGKEYKTRENKTVPEKEKPNLEVSNTKYKCIYIDSLFILFRVILGVMSM